MAADRIERVDAQDTFAYPYYFYTPPRLDETVTADDGDGGSTEQSSPPDSTRLIVEPVNTGEPDDDLETHAAAARATAAGEHNGGLGRTLADRLGCPLPVPAFPRPVSDPADLTHGLNQLDAETLWINDGPLARVDRQLCRMVDDARGRLTAVGVETETQVALTGFSSSAQFAMRFTALHPDRVGAVATGGHNGLVIFPETDAETGREIPGYGHRQLDYPVGVADLPTLTGEPFDDAAFADTDVFCYLGADDRKDALRWPDAWTDNDLRVTAVLVCGPQIHPHRVPTIRETYREHDVSAVFRTYPDTGHSPASAVDDVAAFHRRSLAGATVSELRAAVGDDGEDADRESAGLPS